MKKMNGFSQETFLNAEINKQLEEHNVSVEFPARLAGLSEKDFEVEFRQDRKRDLYKKKQTCCGY